MDLDGIGSVATCYLRRKAEPMDNQSINSVIAKSCVCELRDTIPVYGQTALWLIVYLLVYWYDTECIVCD